MKKQIIRRIANWISIITVVPLISLYVLTALFLYKPFVFSHSNYWYFISLLFLTIIPITAYPLKKFIPKYRDRGRRGERRLAFIMGVSGQVLGIIVSFVFNAPKGVKTVFLAYLFSGIMLTFINAVIGHKASGHAAGISGPFTLLLYFISFKFIYTYLILPAVFWSRLKLNRHDLKELFSGTAVGIMATIFALIVHVKLL